MAPHQRFSCKQTDKQAVFHLLSYLPERDGPLRSDEYLVLEEVLVFFSFQDIFPIAASQRLGLDRNSSNLRLARAEPPFGQRCHDESECRLSQGLSFVCSWCNDHGGSTKWTWGGGVNDEQMDG